MHIITYVKSSSYQITVFERGIGIASSFSGMVVNAFWERALHVSFLVINDLPSVGFNFYFEELILAGFEALISKMGP